MRIDGVLRNIITVPRELQMSVISRIKIMAQMDIAQKNIPQDGRINMTVQQETLDLRVSTLPTIHGEKIVIRLLRKDARMVTLDGIGLQGENRRKLMERLSGRTQGGLWVVGPTVSGQTPPP